MKNSVIAKGAVAALLFAMVSLPVFGDAADEAEAKRRGVPVAQVQAENALSVEKRKNAALEKELADLRQKVADLSKQVAAPPSSATKPGGATSATAPSTMPTVSTSPLNFDGPRAASPLYDGFVKRYMEGDWQTLAADMGAKQKEISALPAGNMADLTYIQRTLAECRPAWFEQARAGKAIQFQQKVWGRNVTVKYQPAPEPSVIKGAVVNGVTVGTVGWPAEKMDSKTKLDSMLDFNLMIPGDNGFMERDACSFGMWSLIGSVDLLSQVGALKMADLPPDAMDRYQIYQQFRQTVTAAYYGTPNARRATCVQALSSLEFAMNGNSMWTGTRPVGLAILIELTAHPDQYKNVKIDYRGPEGKVMYGSESVICRATAEVFLKARLTLAEDRQIRDVIKTLGEANALWSETKIALPQKLSYSLDDSKDSAFNAERTNYLISTPMNKK